MDDPISPQTQPQPSVLCQIGVVASDQATIEASVQRIVDAYIRASELPVCRDRLDKFVVCLAEAAAAVAAADPRIEQMLQLAQKQADDLKNDPSIPAGPELQEAQAAFRRFNWDGPFWPDPPRAVVGPSAETLVGAVVDPKAAALARQQVFDDWATKVWQRRTSYLTS